MHPRRTNFGTSIRFGLKTPVPTAQLKIEVKMVDYEKIEKGGKVKFVRGLDERIVPSPEACKNKLIKLLESVKGDKGSVIIDTYFQQIADRMKDPDPMIGEYNMELFWRLEAAWDKLLAKPVVEEDLFEEFGL